MVINYLIDILIKKLPECSIFLPSHVYGNLPKKEDFVAIVGQ